MRAKFDLNQTRIRLTAIIVVVAIAALIIGAFAGVWF